MVNSVRQLTQSAFRMFSHLSETSVFLILGLSVFKLFKTASFHTGFFTWTCIACVVARAINVYGLSGAYNWFFRRTSEGVKRLTEESSNKEGTSSGGGKGIDDSDDPVTIDVENPEDEDDGKGQMILGGEEDADGDDDADGDEGERSTRWKGSGSFGFGSGSGLKDSIVLDVHKIPTKTQHVLTFSGLRGAVAFACASNFPNTNGNRDAILLVTMFVVLVSVFLLGSTTGWMLYFLDIETNVDESKYEIMLTEVKLRFVASCDVVLSRICLPEELWEFSVRDTLAGYQGSLTDLVGGASSLFSRPDGGGSEGAGSRQNSYDGPLASLSSAERQRVIKEWRRNGSGRSGGGDGNSAKTVERIEGVTSWDDMDGEDKKKRKSVLFSGFEPDDDLTKRLPSDDRGAQKKLGEEEEEEEKQEADRQERGEKEREREGDFSRLDGVHIANPPLALQPRP